MCVSYAHLHDEIPVLHLIWLLDICFLLQVLNDSGPSNSSLQPFKGGVCVACTRVWTYAVFAFAFKLNFVLLV